MGLLFLMISCSEGKVERSYYPDGQVKRELVTKNGLTTMKEFYKSGEISAIYEIIDEKKHGKAVLYFESGEKKSELLYKEGKKNGLCLIYGKNGNVIKKYKFENDSLVKDSPD